MRTDIDPDRQALVNLCHPIASLVRVGEVRQGGSQSSHIGLSWGSGWPDQYPNHGFVRGFSLINNLQPQYLTLE